MDVALDVQHYLLGLQRHIEDHTGSRLRLIEIILLRRVNGVDVVKSRIVILDSQRLTNLGGDDSRMIRATLLVEGNCTRARSVRSARDGNEDVCQASIPALEDELLIHTLAGIDLETVWIGAHSDERVGPGGSG